MGQIKLEGNFFDIYYKTNQPSTKTTKALANSANSNNLKMQKCKL